MSYGKDSFAELIVDTHIHSFTRTRVSEEDMLMATRHRKRCPISLSVRERQIQTAMRCHLTSVRMVIIRKVYK